MGCYGHVHSCRGVVCVVAGLACWESSRAWSAFYREGKDGVMLKER